MEYEIRDADRSHCGAIAAAETKIFSDPWSESSVSSMVVDGGGIVTVAEAGNELLGYAVASLAADEGEILRIAVLPEHRGGGIGRALLSAVTENLRTKGVASVFLEVRESNHPARSLYLSAGFEECGRRKNYYRDPSEDAVLMRLDLFI